MSNEALAKVPDNRSIRGELLALLRDRGPLPRVTIARMLGISATTITRVVSQLAAESLVAEGNAVSPARLGRPATEIALRRDTRRAIGVQIGVGFVHIGITDVLGAPVASTTLEYDVDSDAESVLERISAEIPRLLGVVGVSSSSILGVGVAVPGPVDAAGRRMLLPINLSWRDVPVADRLEAGTGFAVTVEHNVRSMALAEARFAGGRGFSSVAYVYLRTGLGAGLIVEGQPFAGGVHGAVELGHLQVIPGGDKCVCGGIGCIETVVSEAALRRTAARLGIDSAPNPLTSLWSASESGDPAAVEALRQVIAPLATGLAAMVNLLNPELILLGGALADTPQGFRDRLAAETYTGVFPLIRSSVRLEASSLGIDAGVLGGATVALDKFFYV